MRRLHLAAGFVVAVMKTGAVAAGPLEDADAAYERGDYETVLRLIRPLADQGDAHAEFTLGLLYGNGRAGAFGLPHDRAEAVKWFRLAADQGNPAALVAMGLSYKTGDGVRQDYAEAMSWFRRAAEEGNAEAQRDLALAYANGEGVPQDNSLAYVWYSLAAAQGHQLALQNRDIVAKKLTPDQIAEAQRLLREWKPSPQR